jgi:peroxiredoxin Q/BCP
MMNKKMGRICFTLAVVAFGFGTSIVEAVPVKSQQNEQKDAVQVGSQAPDFTAKASNGETISLKDYKDKKAVVLYFYPKDETSVCTKEACAFRDSYQVFKDMGAEVIGVSADSDDSHKSFASHHQLPFILLSDSDGSLRKLYKVPNSFGLLPGRVTFIIDKQGVIRHTFNSMMDGERHVKESLDTLKQISSKS